MHKKKWQKVRIMAKGDELKQIRMTREITGRRFADLIGITKQQVFAIEKGISGASEKTAMKIAKALGVGFNEIFEFVWPHEESMERTIRQGEKANRLYEPTTGKRS